MGHRDDGGFIKFGIDPQEDALRAGDIDAAEPWNHRAVLRGAATEGDSDELIVETQKGSWDSYYANVAQHLAGHEPLAVTAEQARDVVRVLDAAGRSATEHVTVQGPWGGSKAARPSP